MHFMVVMAKTDQNSQLKNTWASHVGNKGYLQYHVLIEYACYYLKMIKISLCNYNNLASDKTSQIV